MNDININKYIKFYYIKVNKIYTNKILKILNNNPCFDNIFKKIKYKRVKNISKSQDNQILIINTENSYNFGDSEIYKIFENIEFNYEILKVNLPNKHLKNKNIYIKINEIWPCYYNQYIKKIYLNPEINNELKAKYTIILKKMIGNINNDITDICSIYDKELNLIYTYKHYKLNNTYTLNHSILECINEYSIINKEKNKSNYLLTDYIFFTIYEPCIMCYMALSHSRINTLIYRYNNKDDIFNSISYHNINNIKLNSKFEIINNLL